jgi:hypothetical protein
VVFVCTTILFLAGMVADWGGLVLSGGVVL